MKAGMGKKYMSNFDVIHTIRESVQKGRTVLARVLFGRRSTAWQLPGNPRGRGNHCPLACDASHCQQVVWQGAVSCSEQFFSALHCPPVVGVALSWDLPSCHDGWELESFPGSSEIERGTTIIQELCIISGWKCRKLHWASLGPCWSKFQMDLSPRQRESLFRWISVPDKEKASHRSHSLRGRESLR